MRPQSIISQSLILPRCAGSGRADNSDNMLDRMARHVNVNNEIGLENREQRMSVRHDPQSKNSNLDVFSSMIIKPSSESR